MGLIYVVWVRRFNPNTRKRDRWDAVREFSDDIDALRCANDYGRRWRDLSSVVLPKGEKPTIPEPKEEP